MIRACFTLCKYIFRISAWIIYCFHNVRAYVGPPAGKNNRPASCATRPVLATLQPLMMSVNLILFPSARYYDYYFTCARDRTKTNEKRMFCAQNLRLPQTYYVIYENLNVGGAGN